MKRLKIDDKDIYLQIWDTAGQERFRTITKNYFLNSNGILLVYSVTDQQSFLNIQNWIKQIQINVSNQMCQILVGNKCDCDEDDREVSYEEGKKLADSFGIPFFETSAKKNTNVSDCFKAIAQIVMDSFGDILSKKKIKKVKSISYQNKPEPKRKGCCS